MATSRYRYTPPPPPWSCPMCLVGACHRCTGRLTVQRITGPARDVPCKHEHPARGPVGRVLADAYRSRAEGKR